MQLRQVNEAVAKMFHRRRGTVPVDGRVPKRQDDGPVKVCGLCSRRHQVRAACIGVNVITPAGASTRKARRNSMRGQPRGAVELAWRRTFRGIHPLWMIRAMNRGRG